MRTLTAGFTALTLMTISAVAADWPQFQGPNRDGTSPETGIARDWPDDGPKELWSVRLSPGYGGPAIHSGEVFLLDREKHTTDILRCIDLESGNEQWAFEHESPGSTGHPGSRTPPTVDDEAVYVVGLMGDFYCVDRKSHTLRWHINLVMDYGVKLPNWGIAQAPLFYENLVIVAPQADDAFLVAFDKKTGKEVWKSEGLGLPGYASPSIVTLGGVQQVVVLSASTKDGDSKSTVAGLALDTGKTLWTYEGWYCKIPIPYPTILPDDRLFITGGYDAGSVMLQVGQQDGAFVAKELFKLDKDVCASQIQQPLYHEGHLYVGSNSNEGMGGLRCFTLDGKLLWSTADEDTLPTIERGNLLLVDGLILGIQGDEGTLHLIEPSPEGYKELAQASVFRGKKIWTPMALSQGKLVLRDQRYLKCLDVAAR